MSLDSEPLYDPKLVQSFRLSKVVGEATIYDFQYLMGITNYNDGDGLSTLQLK